MRIIDCEQGSAQWLEARRGKITASRIGDVLDRLKKGGEGAFRRNYRIGLLAERLSGRTEEHYVSPEMVWGKELEDEARAAYEIEAGNMVEQVGFVLHPTFDYAGASPDGLIGNDGGLEIKCPKTSTHIKWMLEGGVPEEHQAQCLWNMLCCDRAWWYFASYDPRLPDGLKLSVVRMERDDKRIAEIEAEVTQFNCEVNEVMNQLMGRIKVKPVDTRTPLEQLNALMDQMEMVP
jgi:putative phage-type endonuclease